MCHARVNCVSSGAFIKPFALQHTTPTFSLFTDLCPCHTEFNDGEKG